MMSMPVSGEQLHLLPDLFSRTGSVHELVKALRDARTKVEELSAEQQSADGNNETLNSLIGGASCLEKWLSDAGQLDAQRVILMGPPLWELFASLALRLSAQALSGLSAVVARLADRCSGHIRSAIQGRSTSGGGSTPVAETVSAFACAVGLALAHIGQRLADCVAFGLSAQDLSAGFAATLTLLSGIPAFRTQLGVSTAESWLQGTQAANAQGVEEGCFELLGVANAEGSIPLMNIAWRLLKALGLHATCSADAAQEILDRSAQAAASSLAAAASSLHEARALPQQSGVQDPLSIAAFHCCNFVRIARDAPAISKHGLSIARCISSLKPAFEALSRTESERPHTLLSKVTTAALERWMESSAPGVGDFAAILGSNAAKSLFSEMVLLLLASSRSSCDSDGQPKLWGPHEEALLGIAMSTLEKSFETPEPCQLRAVALDALAILCAVGMPSCRRHLISWISSRHVKAYLLALQLHCRIPKWMGAKRSLKWAQSLVMVLAAVEKPGGHVTLGRVHCQVASCVAALLSQLPATDAETWLQAALAPILSSQQTANQSHLPAVWLLARRLGSARIAPSVLSNVACCTVAEIDRVSRDADMSVQAYGIRCLSVLMRKGIVQKDQLSGLAANLRKLLGRVELLPAARLEAWVAHAVLCQQVEAVDDFRVSLRYAVKHLANDISAGVRVASVLAEARVGLLENASSTLDGLCSIAWPLRAGGLAAAKAVQVRAVGVSIPPSNAAAITAVEVATAAFMDEYGRSGMDWAAVGTTSTEDGPSEAKRRRLLLELNGLPDTGYQPISDPGLTDLCLAARSRIDAWLQCVH